MSEGEPHWAVIFISSLHHFSHKYSFLSVKRLILLRKKSKKKKLLIQSRISEKYIIYFYEKNYLIHVGGATPINTNDIRIRGLLK